MAELIVSPRVVGFSFVRNALRYDYPVVESLRSLLPLCEHIVVAVGQSEDGTRELVRSIAPENRLTILDTVWDDTLREGGQILAEQTNVALAAVPEWADWAFYLQADEVLHEGDYPAIRQALTTYANRRDIEGLLFDYRHFYGSYDYLGSSPRWYRAEVRVVRPHIGVYSYRDAQGFRIGDSRKLRVARAGAHVHHYGWVKDPRAQQLKQENFNKLWHDDAWVARHVAPAESFDYGQVDALARFTGTHPEAMAGRITRVGWQFDHDLSRNRLKLKDRLKLTLERWTGYRPGEYRNYRLVR